MNPGCSFLDFYRVNFSLAQHRACLTEAKLRSRSEESIAEPLGYRLLLGTTEKNGPESSVTNTEQMASTYTPSQIPNICLEMTLSIFKKKMKLI